MTLLIRIVWCDDNCVRSLSPNYGPKCQIPENSTTKLSSNFWFEALAQRCSDQGIFIVMTGRHQGQGWYQGWHGRVITVRLPSLSCHHNTGHQAILCWCCGDSLTISALSLLQHVNVNGDRKLYRHLRLIPIFLPSFGWPHVAIIQV